MCIQDEIVGLTHSSVPPFARVPAVTHVQRNQNTRLAVGCQYSGWRDVTTSPFQTLPGCLKAGLRICISGLFVVFQVTPINQEDDDEELDEADLIAQGFEVEY